MMESPETWDLLTSSLAISSLADVSLTWAFLVVQGLVRDEPGDCQTFRGFAENATANEITGPSAAARVALSLKGAGIAQPVGLTPDPWARLAAGRLAPIEPWTGRDGARRYLEQMAANEEQASGGAQTMS
jgi:hypothetical protein